MDPIDVSTEATLDDEAEASPITAFHPNGSLRPLVFVRSWIGELDGYRRLAEALGPERPVYTIAPPRGEGIAEYPGSVGSWAAWCRARIGDALLGEGALLGGISFGGVVALEMARELGRPAGRVLMFDSWLPRRVPRRRRSVPHRLVYHLNRTLELPPEARGPYLRTRAAGVARSARRRVARRLRPPSSDLRERLRGEEVDTSSGRKMPLLNRAIWVAYLKYQPEPCAIPVSLYWCEESRQRVGDSALGWAPWLRGPLETQPTGGGHLTLMSETHAPGLAARVGRSLAAAG